MTVTARRGYGVEVSGACRKPGPIAMVGALLVVVLLALDTGKFSLMAVCCGSFIALAVWALRPRPTVVPGSAFRLGCLCAFSASYYGIAAYHEFVPVQFALLLAVATVAAYGFGLAVGSTPASGYSLPRAAILTMVVTFVGYVIVSLVATAGTLDIEDRSLANLHGGESSNATAIGAMAALGIGLLPAALLGRRRSGWGGRAETALLLFLFFAASWSNVVMLNRSPFIALALATVAGSGIYLASREATPPGRVLALAVPIALTVALVVVSRMRGVADMFLLAQRFADQGLESDRYLAWTNVLTELPDHLSGGRRIDLGPNPYAHNLWLDVAWTSGVIPFATLLLFHGMHVRPVARVVFGRQPLRDRLVLAGVMTAMLVTWMVEPVADFSAAYFLSGFLVLGIVQGCATTSSAARALDGVRE